MASVTYGVGRYAYGLFLPEIRRDFALDTFTLGLIASVGTVVYLLTNIVASAIAIHFKPRTFIVIGGAVTTLGLALVGIATNASTAVGGILLAGTGAGIYTPAQFEAIEAWLLPPWKSRAMGAVNAGATPGKILTGLAAFWVQSSWQHAWLAMAAVSFGVTVWNAWLLPKRAVTHDGMKAKQHLHFRLFTRTTCIPLYGTLTVYGLLFSVYLTFAVDLASSVDAMKSPVDKLFWPLLGIAGLTTVFTGSATSSPNGFKATIALEELALPYTVHHIKIASGDNRQPAFLSLNPYGRIPVIVDRETNITLFESGAILLYLAAHRNRQPEEHQIPKPIE